MKLYVIRETSGVNTITRNGQTVQIGLGEQFTEDELTSLASTTPTTYLCLTDNIIYTVGVLAPGVVPEGTVAAKPIETIVEEMPVAGMVPSSVEPGSEASEA